MFKNKFCKNLQISGQVREFFVGRWQSVSPAHGFWPDLHTCAHSQIDN